jgi:histone deacetylase complex regulatory component SIN3
MSGKQISVKQAEKWLERLKGENQQSYRELAKVLRRYEKTEDDYDCYVKMSQTISSHPDLTRELNLYLDEPNRFAIPRPVEEKIKELMSFVKRNRPEIFDRIIALITDLSKSKGDNGPETSLLIKLRIREIVQGEPELERIIEETLQSLGGADDPTARRNLEHLKAPKQPPPPAEEEKELSRAPPQKNPPERQPNRSEARAAEPGRREARPVITSFSNSSEERAAIRQVEKSVDEQTYQYIIKLTHIYSLNIISRNELFELLAHVQAEEVQLDYLRDILDARETERRKASDFKPLSDMNFSNFERASPSYVSIPRYYPVRCSGKSSEVRLITNDKWVSVPYGSEEGENFSVRNKNLNEINLIKAEDERY